MIVKIWGQIPITPICQGICHYKKGDKQAAETSWDRGLKNAPDNADLWYW